MEITRTSVVSGIQRTRELNITEKQYRLFMNDVLHVQEAFPHLSEDDREFLLTGMTSEEWDQTMSNPEDSQSEYSDDLDEAAF